MTLTQRQMVDNDRSRFDFKDEIVYLTETKRGLTRETVEEISAIKEEPEWMLKFRLRAYEHFLKRPMPVWTDGLERIDFDKIMYYRKPSEREEKSWDDVPDQIKATFERLGIPEAERKFLAGVGAQYDSEVVYHSVKEELSKLGVVFMGTDQALKEYPDIFKKYFATVVPPEDNKFSALNSAVWSGGSFVYVPKGVEVPLPLQAYFRINGENTGQFERTLIVVDEGAKVHYIEGCTAPIYATDSLHVAVVEVVALANSNVRYTTIQNWSNDVYNLVTKRAHAYENSRVEWIDANTGSRKTVKYPSIYLRGRGASADIISVAVAGKGQHQDTGAKAIHLAPGHQEPHRVEVGQQGWRPGHVPRPSEGRAGRHGRRRQRPLRCAHARRRESQRHVPVHRHPGNGYDDDPRGNRGQDQPGPDLLPDEPRPERERGAEPRRPGLPRSLHQGAADGIRHRVQPPGEDGDGRRARLGDARSAEAPIRRRRDRQPAGGFQSGARLDARGAPRRAPAIQRAAGRDEPVVHPLLGPAHGQVRRDRAVPRDRRGRGISTVVPEGASALIEIAEDRVVARSMSKEALDAGVVVDTLTHGLAQHPDLEATVRTITEASASLPTDDKFAQLARALAPIAVLVHVPSNVVLERPIVIRWGAGMPGRGLVSRTIVSLGDNAQAQILEEQVDSAGPRWRR